MAERFVILSDLHLGKDARHHNVDALSHLWKSGDHVIINGDACELHDPRYCAPAVEQILKLQRRCENDDVALTLLAGNHDPGLGDKRHLFFHNKKVLVTHGDAIHPAIAPWCFTAPIIREAFEDAMDSLPVESRKQLEKRLWASQRAAAVKWEKVQNKIGWIGLWGQVSRPWSIVQVLMYWSTFPNEAAKFTREFAPEARYLICGHTHHQGIWVRDGITVINTGAYQFPARPWAVVIEGEWMTVHRVQMVERKYQLLPAFRKIRVE